MNTDYEFKLPDLGEGIHEVEIIRWLVAVGDAVTVNQPLLEVQTDKALVEIPAPKAGTIKAVNVKPGEMARLGDTLVSIQPATSTPKPPASVTAQTGLAGPDQRVLAAPAVRKLALELDVDLGQVPGSGPVGRVLPSDVRAFAEQQNAQPSPQPKQSSDLPASPSGQESTQIEPLHGLRRRIAERMAEAWRVPHVTSLAEVEVSRLVKLRNQLNAAIAGQSASLTYLPFIIKATVQTLKAFPDFNARLDLEQQQIVRYGHYHIGVATALPEGLVVPVIRHADDLSLRQLAEELARLADLARERKLNVDELTGSTFTVTNFGSAGGEQGTPIINPPEVAILGCGRIEPKPVVVKGKIKARPLLQLSLSFDHRLLDGVAAAQFLSHLKKLLNNPKLLMLDL